MFDVAHHVDPRDIVVLVQPAVAPPTDEVQFLVAEDEDELATARKTLREKRRIIQLLLESESRYRDLVETSHDLIWTTDGQGRFRIDGVPAGTHQLVLWNETIDPETRPVTVPDGGEVEINFTVAAPPVQR